MAARLPVLKYEARHNTCALLEPKIPEARPFAEMINFLRRSRIYHAITESCPISYNHITQFWTTAEYHCEITPPVIIATVAGHEIRITEQIIRDVLLW